MLLLLTLTALATGLLAGASFDQSVKQLPARHAIGVRAFSAYSQAADLKQGVPFYGFLGGGVLLLNLSAALASYLYGPFPSQAPIYLSAGLAVLHSLVTAFAAPTNFRQRKVRDEVELARIFDRFARLQAVRCILQLGNFAAILLALAVT